MYRHCIYCSARLGANESLEAFPVGRMLAFDAAKGRLWAVCRACARWNLAPIEERWEAVEAAEKRFAATRMRVQRENIGIARLRDGTRLVRVGSALPGELAGWRYGEPFRRRHRRARWVRGFGASVLLAHAGMVAAWWTGAFPIMPGLVGVVWPGLYLLASALESPGGRRRVQALPREAAPGLPPMVLRRRDLNGARVRPVDGGWEMELPEVYHPGTIGMKTREVRIGGEAAARLLEKALVIRNAAGAEPQGVEAAHALRTEAGSPSALLAGPLRRSTRRRDALRTRFEAAKHAGAAFGYDTDAVAGAVGDEPIDLGIWLDHSRRPVFRSGTRAVSGPGLLPTEALALEMALHEERERRALEGELVFLQSAWREAEEIAGIADRLAGDLPGAEAVTGR